MNPVRTLLIVPPFASVYRAAMGVHVLQSVARQRGLHVDVLYSNLIFAAQLGEAEHEAICEHWFMDFLGERIMGAFAFPGLVAEPDLPGLFAHTPSLLPVTSQRMNQAISDWRVQVMQVLGDWVRASMDAGEPVCIGVSSTFDQTNAALILIRACRAAWPQATIVMGGANCEDEMADGMLAHIAGLDHVFSGDSELAFVEFLSDPAAFAGQKIIRCQPNEAINQLPANDYAQYLEQLAQWLPDSPRLTSFELPYESSRGCWWGQKHHCTFCGLNGQGMGFREKSADKVFDELMALRTRHQAQHIMMTDNIMPWGYFNTLLPRLIQARSTLDIFYEQKANIGLEKAMLLKQAGISRIQPGIEGLHSKSLQLMKKGVRGKQNIALLRYARALGMDVTWNLLYGFPGEQVAWFAEIMAHFPALAHLQPPNGMAAINIDRFSPFFNQATESGFRNLRPHPGYAEIFPQHPNLRQMAYHFCADSVMPTFADSALLPEFEAALHQWQQRWQVRQTAPSLVILEIGADQFLLLDSRGSANRSQTINRAQAAASLVEMPGNTSASAWAVENGTAIEFDDAFVPLALADPQLLLHFEDEFGHANVSTDARTDAGNDAGRHENVHELAFLPYRV